MTQFITNQPALKNGGSTAANITELAEIEIEMISELLAKRHGASPQLNSMFSLSEYLKTVGLNVALSAEE
jgi:hypothetical protein